MVGEEIGVSIRGINCVQTFGEGPQAPAEAEVERDEVAALPDTFGEWDEGQRFKCGSGCMVDLEICMHNMQAQLCRGLLGETVAFRRSGG